LYAETLYGFLKVTPKDGWLYRLFTPATFGKLNQNRNRIAALKQHPAFAFGRSRTAAAMHDRHSKRSHLGRMTWIDRLAPIEKEQQFAAS
jgi:hypothetical protein